MAAQPWMNSSFTNPTLWRRFINLVVAGEFYLDVAAITIMAWSVMLARLRNSIQLDTFYLIRLHHQTINQRTHGRILPWRCVMFEWNLRSLSAFFSLLESAKVPELDGGFRWPTDTVLRNFAMWWAMAHACGVRKCGGVRKWSGTGVWCCIFLANHQKYRKGKWLHITRHTNFGSQTAGERLFRRRRGLTITRFISSRKN